MNKLFEGRTAMVTGSGKNIGKAIALGFARHGANVIVCDYNEENALKTVEEIKALGVQALAMEVGTYNICVNCISPGAISRDGNPTSV